MTTPCTTRMPLLSLRGLGVSFQQGQEEIGAAVNVSLDIAQGECFALVGESGSGKSVTALSVMRLLPHAARITGGQAWFNEVDLFRLPERAMTEVRGRQIGFIFQDPMNALNPVMPLGHQLGEVLARHGRFTGKRLENRTMELFDLVGLPRPRQHLGQYPHQLSGGMRQRAMIAMALAGEPRLLIADEPTTALDVTLQAQVLELLRRLQQETGMALWLITHDFGIVAELAHRIAVMQNGRIVECASTGLIQHPAHTYSRQLLAAMPRLGACLQRPERAPAPMDPTPLLEARNLVIRYPSRKRLFQHTPEPPRVVDEVSFHLYAGETLALVGESGCGKTTLGKGITGLIPATAGHVLLDGKIQPRLLQPDGNPDIQIIFQDPYASMNPRLTVGNILAEGFQGRGPARGKPELQERIEELLLRVGLPAAACHRYPHELSGGQRQRICIARALAANPRILVCDEPTSALDVSVQAQILDLLRELQEQRGLSYLFITHSLAVVSELADRTAVMKGGRIVEIGTTRQVLFEPREDYTRRLVAALPRLYRGDWTATP